MELLKNQPPPPLSAKEKRLFTRLEKDIEQNLKGFLKVGLLWLRLEIKSFTVNITPPLKNIVGKSGI